MAADSAVRGRLHTVVALLATVVLVAATTVGRAQTPDDLREQSEQARQEAAHITASIQDHAAEAEEIEAVIKALAADIDANREAHAAAARSRDEAERTRDTADEMIDALEEDRAATVDSLRRAAVNAFVEFQGTSGAVDFIEDPWGSTWRETLAEIGTGSGSEELDRFRAIDAELDEQRRIAGAAADEAHQLQAELDAEKERLDAARTIQQELRDAVDALIDDLLTEAAALEGLAAGLDSQAARTEAEEIAARKRAEQERLAAAADEIDDGPDADKATGDGDPNGDDGTGSDPGSGDTSGGDDEYSCAGRGFDVETELVAGIEVAATIVADVEGLLAALAAEGFEQMGGGGFRSCERQVELRRQHCGTSEEAIWEWPARRCRPPTARPGQSNHQKALAIDFTYQGRLIRSRSSAVFRALARLAPTYNFSNLPSEPWHWDHASAR